MSPALQNLLDATNSGTENPACLERELGGAAGVQLAILAGLAQGSFPGQSRLEEIGVTDEWEPLPDYAARAVSILNLTGADIRIRTDDPDNSIALPSGLSVRVHVNANANEIDIIADADSATGIHLVID